jgi:protein involved in polysaccharide export with SLBB domain
LKSNESLKELIQFAGGFTPNAYSQQIQVIRNDGNQQVVATVKLDDIQNFKPQNGDIFEVQSILDRFKNRIQISGAVFRPGYFALETSANIKDLLNNAGGLKEDAFKSRAILYRLNADNSQEVLSLNLDEILNGNAPNISLKREDQLVVASKLNMKIQESIAVTGEVLFPGTFSFGSEMVLEDALVLAGGLKIGADVKKIQVSRRSKEANKTQKNGNLSESYTLEVNNNLADLKKFKLEPDDQIHVFRAASFQTLKSISVQGEVLFPGTYPILRNNESISDIMKRTGGLTANAFPEGAVLIRNKEVNEYTEIKDNRANLSLLNINRKNKADSMFFELNNLKNKALIGLNLNKIIKGQKSADLNVSENDIIYIPHYNPLVSISGQVLYPNQSKYSIKKSFKNYISEAGGFTSSSLKRKSFVVYQNGSAKSTKNFLFFKFYPKIQPGAEIIVPTKAERKSVSNVELITITSTLTTLGFLISSLLK